MEDNNNIENEYKLVETKSTHQIIFGNNIYYSSLFNPVKEAIEQVKEYSEKFKTNKNVLVLGLASGYHINQIYIELKKYHLDFQIVVIEPNQKIIELNSSFQEFDSEHIQIYHLENIQTIYEDNKFINFLNEKPIVFKHPVSFNASIEQFKEFLSFRAQDEINRYIHLLPLDLQEKIKSKYSELDYNNVSFSDFINSKILKSNHFDKTDYMLLSFNELINSTNL